MVVIVFGLPGTGKSYFASRLAERITAEYINSDRLRKELFPERTYSDKEKEMVYREMLEKTKRAINDNTNVVLDAGPGKSNEGSSLKTHIGLNGACFERAS